MPETLDSAAGENPNRDVEPVIGLNRSPLSKADFEDLVNVLDPVSAVGTTPTYQAVIEAYNLLGHRDSGHLVVLTDGEPFLVGAGTREYGPRIDRLRRDFVDEASRRRGVEASRRHQQKPGVRLTFVNFKDRGESDDAVIRDLKRYFPRATFEPAIGGEELLDVLERSVRNPTAVWKRNAEPASRRFDLNNNRALTLPLVVQNRDPRAFTPVRSMSGSIWSGSTETGRGGRPTRFPSTPPGSRPERLRSR